MSARTFLLSGLIAGFIAGMLAFAVAHTVGEPPVNAAISFEESHTADHLNSAAAPSPAEEAPLVSRHNQSTWGLLTATLAIGVAFGGIISLIAAFAVGRLGTLMPVASTALVCALGFGSYYLVPMLKYPPNPPSIGNPATIGTRTAEYFSMVVLSILFTVVAVRLVKPLTARWGRYRGFVLPAVGFVVVMVVIMLVLPQVDETPAGFSADVLWRFRIASVLTQATLWGTIGVVLCGLVDRSVRRELAKQAPRDLVGATR